MNHIQRQEIETIDYFEKAAKDHGGVYDEDNTVYYRMQQWLKAQVFELCKDADSILDAGCGNGDFLQKCAALTAGRRLIGVDLSPEMIRQAKRSSEGEKLNIDYQVSSLTSLPFHRRSIHTLTCIGVLHHIHRRHRAIVYGEFCRVASHRLILEIKNTLSPYYPLKKIKAKWGKMKLDVYGTNTVTLSKALEEKGFELKSLISPIPAKLGTLFSPVLICVYERV